jgi:Flp pilus assembly protein TadG
VIDRDRLIRDGRGVALVEFAMVLPVLMMLFVGGYQISDAVAAQRKITAAARTIADLTSQYTTVTDSDLDTILNASEQVMAPYAQTNARMTVSQIDIDATRRSKVGWSRGKNTAKLAAGSEFAVPDSIKQANTSLIVARIDYQYIPGIAASMIGQIPLSETIIMSPRASATVVKQ